MDADVVELQKRKGLGERAGKRRKDGREGKGGRTEAETVRSRTELELVEFHETMIGWE